jgi:predicted heme/steroid binding protein
MKEFTKRELAQYDGANGKPVYVAYEGIVYDVSASFLWKDGIHEVLHKAGLDLTAALKEAPHGDEALKKFPAVGVIREAHLRSPSSRPEP